MKIERCKGENNYEMEEKYGQKEKEKERERQR